MVSGIRCGIVTNKYFEFIGLTARGRVIGRNKEHLKCGDKMWWVVQESRMRYLRTRLLSQAKSVVLLVDYITASNLIVNFFSPSRPTAFPGTTFKHMHVA